MPDARLVIVDTLAKLLRVADLNDYMPVQRAVEQLHDLARKFPRLHIQGLAHCKKVKTDDPFDALLGSTALRGEPDTNIAIYREGTQTLIATETRIGRCIPPTLLTAKLIEVAGADVVADFALGKMFDALQGTPKGRGEKKQKDTYEDRIIKHLLSCTEHANAQEAILEAVEGRREYKLTAIKELTEAGVLTESGVRHSPNDPLVLRLNKDSLAVHDFVTRFESVN